MILEDNVIEKQKVALKVSSFGSTKLAHKQQQYTIHLVCTKLEHKQQQHTMLKNL